MTVAVVLTVVARDRPGIVRAVAAAIADEGGNWVDSSLARLGGEFAGIVRVDVDRRRMSALESRLQALAGDGIQIGLRATGQPVPDGRPVQLTVTSVDQPGIVFEISEVLAGLGVSIETFKSHVEPGSMTGAPLFLAHARLRVPAGLALERVEEALAGLAGDLLADLDLAVPAATDPPVPPGAPASDQPGVRERDTLSA